MASAYAYCRCRGFGRHCISHGEEAEKGSIAPGKLADFVLLEENPLEVKKEDLAQIKVLQTISRGETIYLR